VPAGLIEDDLATGLHARYGEFTIPLRRVARHIGDSVSCAIYEFRPSRLPRLRAAGGCRSWRRGLQRGAAAPWQLPPLNPLTHEPAHCSRCHRLRSDGAAVRDLGLPAGGDEVRRGRDQPPSCRPVCAPVWRRDAGLAWARWRGIALFGRDQSLRPGLLAGLLFGLEFVFIFVGVDRTTVSRMVVFLYTAPCFTVLGLHFFVPGERMGWRQWAGVMLAFAGPGAGLHRQGLGRQSAG
jgi:hypothetical protein